MKSNTNNEMISSLKNYDFKGWTSDKIIEKYEHILATRERQIEDLSLEFGNVYKDSSNQTDLLATLQAELLQANKKIKKLENILEQELNNKEIMFIRLENKDRELDQLKIEINKLKSQNYNNKPIELSTKIKNNNNNNNKISELPENSNTQSNQIEDNNKDIIYGKDNNNENKITISVKNEENKEKSEKSATSSNKTLDKIREMKERKSRIQNKNSITLNNTEAFDAKEEISINKANENLEEIAKEEDEENTNTQN